MRRKVSLRLFLGSTGLPDTSKPHIFRLSVIPFQRPTLTRPLPTYREGMILISVMHTFRTRGGVGEDARYKQAKHEFVFIILTSTAYVNERMTHGELELIAYVRVEVCDVNVLNGLILPAL